MRAPPPSTHTKVAVQRAVPAAFFRTTFNPHFPFALQYAVQSIFLEMVSSSIGTNQHQFIEAIPWLSKGSECHTIHHLWKRIGERRVVHTPLGIHRCLICQQLTFFGCSSGEAGLPCVRVSVCGGGGGGMDVWIAG